MKDHRVLLGCVWILVFFQGCASNHHNHTTDHPRHHRHERSRLKRQHGPNNPEVYYLWPSDPNLPPDQSQAESGDWGPWSGASECSRTCGGGVQSQTRDCSPYSRCRGAKIRYFSCNIQDCPDGADFRAEQCAEYNNVQYEGQTYEWVPYMHAENQCALNCMPKRERYYYRHKDAVTDGTPCNEDSFDVCVQGKCLPVGCDKLLGSTAKEDSCRVCGGDGSTCKKKSGVVETNAPVPGYMDLFLIPANATNIRIQERRPSNNYLAIRNQDNHFYLNGDWTINNSGVLKFAGTKFHYTRKPFPHYAPEVIYALGPTTEPLYIALLYQEPNPGIEYVYSVPVGSVRESPKQGYSWRTEPFSECNVTCGGGIQTRKVYCAYGAEQVGSSLCDPASEPASSKLCGELPCPAEWVVDKWSACSAPCGELGYQTRQVNCLQAVGFTKVPVTEHLCKGDKPESSRPCQEKGPCPVWHIGPWKPCDRLCGEGKQTRDVVCYKKVDGLKEILPDSQCLEEKPSTEQPCMIRPCAGLDWITSDWTGCGDKCGLAIETRIVKCADESGNTYNESLCHADRKPELVRNCTYVPCSSQWFASQWSDCSAKCGEGIQTRNVICASLDGNTLTLVDNSKCDEKSKPEEKMECKAEQECKGEWFISPFGPCSKPCGGGVQERIILCLRDNVKVNQNECDEEQFIGGNTEECNKQPCGEDELMPVSTAQVITEEESEECDYEDYYDYDETTDDDGIIKADGFSTVAVSGVTDEIEGSGGVSDDLIFISSTSGPDDSSVGVSGAESSSVGVSGAESSSTEGVSPKASSIGEEISVALSSLAGPGATETLADEPTGGSTLLSEGSSDASDTGSSSPAGTELPGTTSSSELPTGSSSMPDATEIPDSSALPGSSPGGSAIPEVGSTDSGSTGAASGSPSGSSIGGVPSESTIAAGSESPSGATSSDSAGTESSATDSSASESTTDSSAATETSSSDESATDSASTSASIAGSSVAAASGATEVPAGTTAASGATEAPAGTTVATSGATEAPAGEVSGSSSAASASTAASMPSSVSGVSGASSAALIALSTTTSGVESSGATESGSTEGGVSDAGSESPESTTQSGVSSESSIGGSSEVGTSSDAGATETPGSSSPAEGTEGSESSTLLGSSQSSTEASSLAGSTDATESSSLASSESSFSPESTELTEAVFGFSTESDVDKAVKKEKKLKKCKPRKGKRKCVTSTFGCCPDGKSEAKGPFAKGCPMPKTCEESKHGCCSDGLSPAKGPNKRGCPKSLCDQTLFGCCSDEITPSQGNNFEGCPIQTTPLPDCNITTYGCCPDGKEAADGPYYQGCTETCSKTEFGCCPDGFTVKIGLDYAGCNIPSNETCASSEHGCCPDGLSVAQGPDDEGCQNCTESRFGCCPDGVLAAKGLRHFGCAPACQTSDYGCCSDNTTFAHGPNQEGCCLNTPFGCCADNIVPASGPNYYGCDCQNSIYGCCPDGKTSATGPENVGCGCQYSEYGCCPDKQTAADGPTFEGCPCHTYQFGCCPDGETIVKGPNLQGCGCEHSAHGCCPDGKTRKREPDINCTCEATKYGCCPDGVNEAQGDNFEGCENVPITGEVCSLPRANGECREFKIVYWFDNTYGGCARFWYGGCGGNDNRFKSQEECKNVCVHPTGKDVCSLPVSKGSCRHDVPMWYYDKTYKQCRPFSWTGCLGNSNRFHTREECELQCGSQEHLDPCEQTLEHGPCNGTFDRWYFNKEEHDCIPFIYGGCKGTQNNFLSQASCKAKCLKPDQQRPECSLPKAAGTCTEKVPKWYFESKEKRCIPFYYSGCGGNGNHFDSVEECEGHCPVKKEKDVCVLPSAVGSCSTYALRWYYDTLESKCKQFYWGGCDGNGNNFITEQDCLRRCDRLPEPETGFSPEMCNLPAEKGRCSESLRQWHYDSADGTCKVFSYSGCEGNGNRFETEEQCLQSCSNVQDPCSLPKVQGPCDQYTAQWYFDRDAGSCRQFYYGGCHGNANRYNSVNECRAQCLPNEVQEPEEPRQIEPQPEAERPQQPQPAPVPDETDICYLRYDPGPCYETIPAWYYDPANERCTQFVYGGCRGNANRFVSEEQCERQCGVYKSQEACSDDVEMGACNSPTEKFYFDREENICRSFTYSGCGGNPNRFSTVDECNSICRNFTEPKIPQGTDQEETNRGICGLPFESGMCEAILKRFYYDDRRRTCISFVYTGCGGNLNNFQTLEDCTNTCVAPSVAPAPQPEQPDPNAIDVGAGPVKEYCPQVDADCALLRCSYGIEKWVDDAGCEKCRCHDPCAAMPCPDRCIVRLVPERSGNVYRGFCEGQAPNEVPPGPKPGSCPEFPAEAETECSSNCNFDSDCPDTSKCCYNGCATVCSPVAAEEEEEEEPKELEESPPYILDDTEQRVEGEEGNLVGLHCIAHGSPTPTVLWKRNGEMLSPISGSKYRISQNGTLEIILLKREDQGMYTCEASNGVEPTATRDYELIVRVGRALPVSVVNNKEDTDVVVTLGSPAVMRCYAIGFPIPNISWFRGSTVLPVSNNEFEQRRDNSLYIRAVSLTNLGFYTCQVYNGQGRPASHTLVLKAFGPINADDPNDVTYNEFLVPSSSVPSSDRFKPPVPPYQPPPERERPIEPLRFGVNSTAHHVKAGSNVTLTCNLLNENVDEAIDVMFTWIKDDQPVAPVADRIAIQGNQLLIANADEPDSGNYTCVFDYDGKEGLTDTVPLIIQRTLLHADCKDHNELANCSLIVSASYCVHKYYAKFCCKSCTEAGQLPSHVPGSRPPWEVIQPAASLRRRTRSSRMMPSRLSPINAPDRESDRIRFKSPVIERLSLQ